MMFLTSITLKTAMQSEAASNLAGVLNAPKWMMVALDPLSARCIVLNSGAWQFRDGDCHL